METQTLTETKVILKSQILRTVKGTSMKHGQNAKKQEQKSQRSKNNSWKLKYMITEIKKEQKQNRN